MRTTCCTRRVLAAIAAAVLAALVSPAVRADDGPGRNHQPPPGGPMPQIHQFVRPAAPAGDLNERLNRLQQRMDEVLNEMQQLRREIAQRPPMGPGAEGRKPRRAPVGPAAEGRKPHEPPMGPGAEGRKPRKPPVGSPEDRKPDGPRGEDGPPPQGGPPAGHNAGMDAQFPSEFEAAPIFPTGSEAAPPAAFDHSAPSDGKSA